MNRIFVAATLVVASAGARAVFAQDSQGSQQTSTIADSRRTAVCASALDSGAVVRCALAASPDVRQARAQLDATAGRRTTAELWLPSSPTVGGTLALRHRPAPDNATVLNWSVAISQELEIAGQRSARVEHRRRTLTCAPLGC